MADSIKFKKGPLVKLPTLNLAEPGFVDDAGTERLYIGGLSGNVSLPNMNDIPIQQMFPTVINLQGLTIGNLILTYNNVVLGTITLG